MSGLTALLGRVRNLQLLGGLCHNRRPNTSFLPIGDA